MGKRGPAPSPAKLKVLRGETRPSRVNYAEPEPRPGLPEKPLDLIEGAGAVWDRVVRELGHTGVITAVDTDSLRAYAEAVARYEEAARFYSGPLIKGKGGELVRSPLHQIMRDNASLLLLFARELGLTPSARSGIRAPSQPASDGFEDLRARTRAG